MIPENISSNEGLKETVQTGAIDLRNESKTSLYKDEARSGVGYQVEKDLRKQL